MASVIPRKKTPHGTTTQKTRKEHTSIESSTEAVLTLSSSALNFEFFLQAGREGGGGGGGVFRIHTWKTDKPTWHVQLGRAKKRRAHFTLARRAKRSDIQRQHMSSTASRSTHTLVKFLHIILWLTPQTSVACSTAPLTLYEKKKSNAVLHCIATAG